MFNGSIIWWLISFSRICHSSQNPQINELFLDQASTR